MQIVGASGWTVGLELCGVWAVVTGEVDVIGTCVVVVGASVTFGTFVVLGVWVVIGALDGAGVLVVESVWDVVIGFIVLIIGSVVVLPAVVLGTLDEVKAAVNSISK